MNGNISAAFIDRKVSRETILLSAGDIHPSECFIAEVEHLEVTVSR